MNSVPATIRLETVRARASEGRGASRRAGGAGGVIVHRVGGIGHRANGSPCLSTSIVPASVGWVKGAVSWDRKQASNVFVHARGGGVGEEAGDEWSGREQQLWLDADGRWTGHRRNRLDLGCGPQSPNAGSAARRYRDRKAEQPILLPQRDVQRDQCRPRLMRSYY